MAKATTKTEKKAAKKSAKAISIAPGASVEPPSAGAPTVPKGWKPPAKKAGARGATATTQQVRDAGDVAREISTSTTYEADFGIRAPDADTIASQLNIAKAWSDEVDNADAWQKYVHAQRDAAWQIALATTKDFSNDFTLADEDDATIEEKYPQTKAFLGVRTVAAKKGAQTRKKKNKPAKT